MKLNNGGFSILRLLLIIVLVVVLLLVARPSYNYIKYVTDRMMYTNNIGKLEAIATDYASDNIDKYRMCSGSAYSNCLVSIDTLKNNDYIYDDKILVDPQTKENLKGDILVCYNGNNFSGKYIKPGETGVTCDSLEEKDGETRKTQSRNFKSVLQNLSESDLVNYSGEMRYVGADAYNYVKIDNTTWRVIGIVDNGYGEKKVKLTSTDVVVFSFFSDGLNNFKDSKVNDYLNNGDYYVTLSESVKTLIDKAYWPVVNCQNASDCISGNSNTGESLNIGIISIRDLALSTSCGTLNCLDSSYMDSKDEFLLNFTSNEIYKTNDDGQVTKTLFSDSANARPTMYIKDSTLVDGGTGTKSNPYVLKVGE